MLTRCFDAAYPPATVPAGAGACLGYIGGRATHVWTPQQWQPFAALRQFPCWVVDTSIDPATQADEAFAAMRRLGWFAERALIFDMEAIIDPDYVRRLELVLRGHGTIPVAYESESVIGANGATHVWAALWDGKPTLPANWWAKQFMAGGGIDWSVVSPELMELGGRGRRQL